MTRELMMFALLSFATICVADDAQNAVPATAAQRAARPRQVPVGQAQPEKAPGADSTSDDKAASTVDQPKFVSEAKWVLAGYNSDEIVYTVFVTNQDARIIRCTTEVKGFYFENGAKLSISDRQITTVFPNQPTRVGYWMDMDQQSGASYSVKCHPV
jgi:hypothetical protein